MKLHPPTSQLQSVLYGLIKNNKGVDEQSLGFNSFRSRLSELREYLTIKSTPVKFKNRFGHKSEFLRHWLTETEKQKAIKLYLKLVKK